MRKSKTTSFNTSIIIFIASSLLLFTACTSTPDISTRTTQQNSGSDTSTPSSKITAQNITSLVNEPNISLLTSTSLSILPSSTSSSSTLPPSTSTTAALPTSSTQPPKPTVALTFDDGPDSMWTPKFVEMLSQVEVKATFFMLGTNARALPSIVQLVHNHGFAIAGHTMDHKDLTKLNDEQFSFQIDEGNRIITEITGKPISCVRPPYGTFDSLVDERLTARGLTRQMWTVDSKDWKKPGVEVIVQTVMSQVKPGSIILFHDAGDRQQTYDALPFIIWGLREQGYEFVTLC